MENYLKRIANEPYASPTTPLGSSAPGRSRGGARPDTTAGGIFPESNRIIRQAADSPRASRPTFSGKLDPRMGQGLQGIVDALTASKKISPKGVENLTNFFSKFNTDFVAQISDDKMRSLGLVMGGLNSNITEFTNSLASSAPKLAILRPLLPGVGKAINAFIWGLLNGERGKSGGPLNPKDTKTLQVLSSLGRNVWDLTKYMALSTPFMPIVKLGIKVVTSSIQGFVSAMNKIDFTKANQGVALLPKVGLGILAFAGSLAGASLLMATTFSDPLKFLGLFAVMAASGLALNIIGKSDKNIKAGALTVGLMGLGLLAFSGSLALSAMILPPIDKVLPLALTIAALGGVYYLAGKLSGDILMGSLAMGAVGIATWIISKPIETLGNVLMNNPSAAWQIPLMITGLGAAFALAGIGPVPLMIASGALALGVAGGALWVLSKGLTNMLSLPTITKEKAEGIELALRSVVTGFGKSFQDLSLKESLTLPLKIPMVGLMGLTLFGLASGIANYQAKAGSFGPKDSENLKNTISGLSEAFATAGSTQGMSKLFGFNVGSNDVERGIDSTMKMGKNLKNLADGVLTWKKMPLTPADVQTVSDNVGRVLNVIPGIFAGIGKTDAGTVNKVSFLGLSFESPFAKGDTERGISATMEMGENLKNLADGVMAWKDGGKAGFKSADLPGIVSNIQSILGAIPGSFASLGAADRETEGIFPWSDGDITKGVDLAEKLGPSLQGISKLLETVKTGGMEKAVGDISTHIPNLLKSYASSLNDFSVTVGGDPDDAIDSLEDFLDLADPMAEMAKSITAMTTAMQGQLDLGKISAPQLDAYSKYFTAIAHISAADNAVLKKNLDAVVKSGFSNQEANAALSAQQVSVTNQINRPPQVKVNVPQSDLSAQEKMNAQILEALKAVASLLAQGNSTNAKTVKALDDLNHQISAGIKIKEGFG